jgi:hypothetical protein
VRRRSQIQIRLIIFDRRVAIYRLPHYLDWYGHIWCTVIVTRAIHLAILEVRQLAGRDAKLVGRQLLFYIVLIRSIP